MKHVLLIGMVIAGLIGISGCGEKPPAAELKSAQDAVSAAKAAPVDPSNADLKKADEDLSKAQADIDTQGKKTFGGNYANAKTLLAEAKTLSDKALADHMAAKAKAEADAKAKAEEAAKAAAAKKKGGAPAAAKAPAAAPAGAPAAAPAAAAKKKAKAPTAQEQLEAAQKKAQDAKAKVDSATKK